MEKIQGILGCFGWRKQLGITGPGTEVEKEIGGKCKHYRVLPFHLSHLFKTMQLTLLKFPELSSNWCLLHTVKHRSVRRVLCLHVKVYKVG